LYGKDALAACAVGLLLSQGSSGRARPTQGLIEGTGKSGVRSAKWRGPDPA